MGRALAHGGRESGQAAPIYVAMVASLLFLALAFFAVGQAGATRNGAQSGADAAALAAARESRDAFGDGFLDRLTDPDFADFLRELFGGDLGGLLGELLGDPAAPCAAAGRLAAANGAEIGDCIALADGRWGYTVAVTSGEPVGDTILPGTEGLHANTTATAVVESRCDFEEADEPPPFPGDGGEGDGGEGDGDGGEDQEPGTPPSPSTPSSPPVLGTLLCEDGESFELDPERPDGLPDMSDLFTVRLDVD
ncbi:pilus assembly protein TadG-related protein [Streptomyces sp. NPDC057638]|uniref:pilus assembly protein TadG-related protein n=1 Tax=Streptomyces sp. NPDC057638 TaxID=3346190 RepID=UPI0036CAD2EB